MNELVLLESRTARQSQLSDLDDSHALNALNKAKALMMAMWNGTGVATTEQMAEYYEVPSETVDSVIKRNRKELEPDGLKAIRGNDLKELKFIMNFAQNGTTSLTIWTPRAAVRLGMLLRDSLVAQQVRTALLDRIEARPEITRSEFQGLATTVDLIKLQLTTSALPQPRPPALPQSIDPIPQPMVAMTERTCVNRAIRSYVYRRKEVAPVGEVTETEQEVYRRMYLELKYRYRYDVRARLKKSSLKSKIEQIEADGQMCNLLAICHHLLS